MVAPLLLSIRDAYVTFGGKPLFDGLSLNIHQGSKICLVGKNGAGKTTLMHMITGERELDGGERWQEPEITIGYLQQEMPYNPEHSVFEFIFSGLPKDKQNEDYQYMVPMVTEPLELNPDDLMKHLSGGQIRRASLARILVEEPDILLLDEPTNHLDLGAIEWLEEYLHQYRGTLLCVSHDKTFLKNISDKIFWLDRGRVRVCPKGFAHFEEWSQLLLEQVDRDLRNRARIVAQEEAWASRGVKARRKRNIRRLEEMKKARDKLKADKGLFNQTMRKIDLAPIDPVDSSKVVAEFYRVNKSFGDENNSTTILQQFNLRIMKGDRIGILGKNGSGKTTFLRLLLGEEEPDTGKVKLARNLEYSYFDQRRSDLNPKESLWKNLCPNGGDYVEVNGKPRHVCGYLKDFMFDPKIAKDMVGTLSGGQKNRLMLAKVLANPGACLILDEPTNDLDMDTLDMLEEVLANYKGTLFVVSHDRDFLDQTVTKILAFEGQGDIGRYIGGYSDYLAASGKKPVKHSPKPPKKKKEAVVTKPDIQTLTNKEKYELEKLPKTIQGLEEEVAKLQSILENSQLYQDNPKLFDETIQRMPVAEKELEDAELRWLELEEKKGSMDS
jgi:ATP-binding cassette subfamily F protein uup